MKTLLKSLIVWLMLLAIPFQGYASATMLCCAPAPASAAAGMAAPGHDHQAMLAGAHAQHAHAAAATAAAHDMSGHAPSGHHASTCNTCAICCLGAAMAAPHPARVPVQTQGVAAVPADSGFVQTVHLALPERPPQASLA